MPLCGWCGLGWVAQFGLIDFDLLRFDLGECVSFRVMLPYYIITLQASLYILLRMRPLRPFACSPRRTKTRDMNIRHKHRARLFRTIKSIGDPIKDVIRHRDGYATIAECATLLLLSILIF